MGMTMIEKVLARHCYREDVHAGDIIECNVDVAVLVESLFSQFRRPKKVWNPDRVWLITDHAVPAPNVEAANDMILLRQFARKAGISNLIDVGNHGISHVVLPEKGIVLPGSMLVHNDSHTASAGALNCAGRGIGVTDMVHVMCKGEPGSRLVLQYVSLSQGKLQKGYMPETLYTLSQESMAISVIAILNGLALQLQKWIWLVVLPLPRCVLNLR